MTEQPAVLVVEDEPLLREVILDVFAERGLVTVSAANGDDALVAFEAHPEIRVLFSDVTMPGKLDGCDLAYELHLRRPTVKVILTSGKRLPRDYRIPDGGIFIPKPYLPDTIARMLLSIVA